MPTKTTKRVKAIFRKGDKVVVETLGYGTIESSYFVKGKYLYKIRQEEFIMGNVPEDFIHLRKSPTK